MTLTLLLAGVCHGQCVGGVCAPPAWWSRPTASPQAVTPPEGACRIEVGSPSAVNYGTRTLVAVRGVRGYVVTCHHLFSDGAGRVTVSFPGGARHGARVIAQDDRHDLALLEISGPGPKPAALATTSTTGPVTAGGFGGDGRFVAVTGPVVGYAKPLGAEWPSVQIRGAVRSGDSGGPVLNAAGELVGVVWGVRNRLSYATVGQPLKRLLARIPASADSSPGMVRVNPSKPIVEAHDKDLSQLKLQLDAMRSCQCDGDCVRRGDLDQYALRNDLESTRSAAEQRDSELLGRLRSFATNAAQQAKRAALSAVGERLAEVAGQRSTLNWLTVATGALGLGTPVGIAVFGLGWLARRRRRRDRGSGGPREEPFRARGERPEAGGQGSSKR